VIDTKQPFFHPAIISTLKEYFFTGSRGSKADKHDNRFQSSLATGDAKNERELPIAMVSLVAAMVRYFPMITLYAYRVLDSCFA
jgi:hypothetical protein